ncbi:hypothetical protein NG800_003915 [Epilithonimonas ginsengisoli]|uniref:Uncharacterized protein n=1 Tax=Epilithonimonas ginsengisoli TaxID=1245592 RepID=A0ABU4JEF7_9FLAO|nr:MULTISPECIES: hypothetical protein [Chryseobacterium group]MBV6879409.1 hypothetical protein [Epilithonimonas sp. FP105]MDW8548045.1 hypothetical protein [Epilithonimonas ginsengisoli]OAH64512.1 hypothetical protein AXA65_19360 [Chryseobacterium sp. FP211-J200]
MKEIIYNLSTREISILVWSTLIIIPLFYIGRKELKNILSLFFDWKILIPFFLLVVYYIGTVYFLKLLNFWDKNLLKDTIVWFAFSGISIFFNVNKITSINYFKKALYDSLKVLVLFEFIMNFYTFSLLSELIIVPIITSITILYEFSKHSLKKNIEHKKVNKFLGSLLSIFGIVILLNLLYQIITNYQGLFTESNLKLLILPILLLLLSFPFYYFLALIVTYETFFVRINCMFRDDKIKKELKKQIIINAKINLNRLTLIDEKLDKKEIYDKDIQKYIKSIR